MAGKQSCSTGTHEASPAAAQGGPRQLCEPVMRLGAAERPTQASDKDLRAAAGVEA